MSVQVASAETTAKIANMIYRIVKWGYDQERISLSYESIDYIRSIWRNIDSEHELRIFEVLQEMNLNNYNTCYKQSIENGTIASSVAEPYACSRFKRSEGFSKGEVGTEDYQKIKSLMFFIYQCDAHPTAPDTKKMLNVLRELENGLFHYIIENTPEYKDAIWG